MRLRLLGCATRSLAAFLSVAFVQVASASERMQARSHTEVKVMPNGGPVVEALAPGQAFDVIEAREGWLSIKITSGSKGWIPQRQAEPPGGCYADSERQLDFMLKHHGALAFNDEFPEFASGRFSSRSVTAGHRTHTRKSLRDALARYLPAPGTIADTVMFLPYVGRTALCLLVIDVNGIRGYGTYAVPENDLQNAIDAFVEHLAPGSRTAYTSKCKGDPLAKFQGSLQSPPDKLAALLFPSAIERALYRVKNLIVVPHGVLAIVPYAALKLPVSGKYLIDDYAYTVAPGLTQVGIAAGLHRPAQKRTGASVVIGDPTFDDQCGFDPLPGARLEAQGIAKVLGTSALVGDKASIQQLASLIKESNQRQGGLDFLHFATHAIADRSKTNSSEGFLALAGGDRLTVSTLKELGFRGSRLVVLSACQTGLGWIDDVGTVGIARAFHLAGAHEVLMSLWDLQDAGTADFVIEFTQHYTQMSSPAAATALQRNIIEFRKRRPDASPAVWAAFSVFGVGPFE